MAEAAPQLSAARPARPAIGEGLLRRPFVPLVGGVLSLILAGIGELIVQSGSGSPLSLVLYLAAILLFTVSAWPMPPAESDMPSEEVVVALPRSRSTWGWAVLGLGTALAVGLDVAALLMIRQDVRAPLAPWLWLAAMVLIAAVGVALHRWQEWPARWGRGVWPSSVNGRRLAVAALALVMLAAVLARVLWLDKVPLGINADEGDRAAVSIQIIKGANNQSIFEAGWYWISMVYFWLLAQVMNIFGVSFVGARMFGALAGIVAVGMVVWIGVRNFGLRVGLLAGAILSVLAVALQFSRETTEAGPTGMLWAVSAAFFFEASRRGRMWAWAGAGIAGGLSIYFYPTGRLWAIMALAYCVYLLVHGLGGRRWAIFRGAAFAAVAAVVVMAPFLLQAVEHWEIFTLRAQETSIFTRDNPTRLNYYNPEWNVAQLLAAQTVRSVGVFNQFSDGGGFFPISTGATGGSITTGLLAVLTLLGLGWCCLRWRDPRFVLLAGWFWVGFSGVIVTVETPNVQRMAAAVPVVALFSALVLDNLARRIELAASRREGARFSPRTASIAAWALVGVVALYMMGVEAHRYFVVYGSAERWPHPTILGQAVNEQGTDTRVFTIGRQFHMVNSGWVRLLAPWTPRGGIQAPGNHLPLAEPADHNIAFLVFPAQEAYLPYLADLYPGGAARRYVHPTEQLMFTVYRLPREDWAALQGATAEDPSGEQYRVAGLGVPPEGWSAYPSAMRWTAGLTVPQYWNYAVRIGPGPARLAIDGVEVLSVPEGTPVMSTTLSLARGKHAVSYEGTLAAQGRPALFEIAQIPEEIPDQPPRPLVWASPGTGMLVAGWDQPHGLYGLVRREGRAEQRTLDPTLATCCLSAQVRADGRAYTATWTGSLDAPATGVYSMTLLSQGAISLKLDGSTVFESDEPSDQPRGFMVELTEGPHPVEIVYTVKEGPGGIEWVWTPPGGTTSIVPPSVLSPPDGAGVGPPLSPGELGPWERQPVDMPVEIVR
ncbi:MAG TPA: glycosyltransferase family 39 protein [Chloroflexia bacterium]|nr:glycosyltransferase family 39 protein [Chloroflexia bacterium]